MPVDLSIKRVPDEVARRLRRRAEQHHRSLQGELMVILQEAVATAATGSSVARESAAPAYQARGGRRIAPASESALIIRQAREGRTFTVADLHRFSSSLGPATPAESTAIIRQGRDSR
jgi:plasmid stability protein